MKDEVSVFIDCHLYIGLVICRIYIIILEHILMKNSIEKRVILFLLWSNLFGNLLQLLLAKGLDFAILILGYMNESIIQPEPFPKHFCMFDIIVVYIDSNTSSVLIFINNCFVPLCVNRNCHVLFYHPFSPF